MNLINQECEDCTSLEKVLQLRNAIDNVRKQNWIEGELGMRMIKIVNIGVHKEE